ncbi:MAG: hypothetical protein LKF44_08155, partial [Atopobiaceae bacterium]|nr:hypothetical protein [Atopobiaceae bacterium]
GRCCCIDPLASPFSSVVSLRLKVYKPAVRWFIVTVDIDTVDGAFPIRGIRVVSVGHRPVMKCREALPFVTDPYPASAVVLVVLVVLIAAALTHAKPNLVKAAL